MTQPLKRQLPVLESSRFLRFFVFTFLYVAQGLPWGMFVVGIPAWLAGEGYSASDIGSVIAIAGMPWSFKLIAGPFMDRFSFPAMGRRRPWVLMSQAGIFVSLLVLMSIDIKEDGIMALAWAGFLISFFCAVQDVAVDGMAIDVLKQNERARANAFMFGGQMAGISAAGSGTTYALSHYGLDAAALIVAGSVLVIMTLPLMLRERAGERLLPWTAGEASMTALASRANNLFLVIGEVSRSLILPMSLLLILCEFLNRAASGLFYAITPIVTVQELGWLDTESANWTASAGALAAFFGVLVAPWIDKKGAGLALITATAGKLLIYILLGTLPQIWPVEGYFPAVIIVLNLLGQVVTVAIIALF
ncbi:MAG: MFS transporter, partial [Gammaproteobacteria bacterium]|nr:MFS transporter [Gammaproteobacteria bacterium]